MPATAQTHSLCPKRDSPTSYGCIALAAHSTDLMSVLNECCFADTSVSCHAELMLRRPWFQAQTHEGRFNAPTELDTLGQMFSYLGTPSEESWPGMSSLRPGWSFEPLAGQPLKTTFPQVNHKSKGSCVCARGGSSAASGCHCHLADVGCAKQRDEHQRC